MVVDAERRLAELREMNEFDGVLFKMRRDPRVTPVGARLRKWSLDELPQLFNVLLGEMSLVGPRPPLPDEAALYADHVRRRLVVKPGLTGLWQVSGRNERTYHEMVALDVAWVQRNSIRLYLSILARTPWVLLARRGAA
jgi:lipopolysaccharide/colanic/teichoic acid biosynthesis glycosyltransferase